jgi:hypothetical protein
MNIAFKIFFSMMIASLMAFTFMPPDAMKVYPVPPGNENSLFYIQRTKNTNAIVYEVNKGADGKINTKDPVKVYWIRYASDSTTEELTAIQRTYAYGVHSNLLKGQNNSFLLQLVAYKKRNIFLMPVPNSNRYVALMNINGKMAEIKRIFVSISGGTFWFPKVDYIELSGKDPSTHQPVVERFVP